MTFWQYLLSLLIGKPPKPPVPPDVPPTPTGNIPQQLLDAVNKIRRNHGLSLLTLDSRLNASAQKHASWMLTNNILSHTGANGSTVWKRINDESYFWKNASEIIAQGQTSVQQVIADWKSDPPHMEAMVGSYKNMGAGLAGKYWVIDFGTEK